MLVVYLLLKTKRDSITARELSALLGRWIKVHGIPLGLIRRKEAATPVPATEPDLIDYSFDRAVVCDRARTVDLLIANNFHFENNCAIISHKGYPERIFPTVMTMLARNPRLKVYVLHDATREGCTLAHTLANSTSWFKGRALVIDVGLRPDHAASIPTGYAASTLPVSVGKGIDPKESQWLTRRTLELAVLPPEQIVKRLYRAMVAQPAGKDKAMYEVRDGFLIDKVSFKVPASASDGGADSFG